MGRTIYLLMLFMTFGICDAQTPDWQWARGATFSNPADAGEGNSIDVDNAGNVYITGQFRATSLTFGAYTLYSPPSISGHHSVYIAKYDSSGNVLWAKNSGGFGSGIATGIACDPFGNVYITGIYESNDIIFDADTLFDTCIQNIFLVKYDSFGDVVWAKAIGDTANNYSYYVATDPLGDVFITGGFSGASINFGSYSLSNSGHFDMFLAKFDPSGNALWAQSATSVNNGLSSEMGLSTTSDAAGNAYISGYFSGPYIIFGTDTLLKAGGTSYYTYDMFIAKYDSSGNYIWAKSAGGIGDEMGMTITAFSSDKVFVSGVFHSQTVVFGSDTLIKIASQNTFIVSYDSSGNVLWAKSFHYGQPHCIAADSLDNIYLTGGMYNTMVFDTLILQGNVGIDPMYIVMYNSSGQPQWAKSLNSGGYIPNGISPGTNGSVYVVSDFKTANSYFFVGNDSLITTGQSNIFVAKLGYDFPTGTATSPVSPQWDVMLYPNPAGDELIISGLLSAVQITLYNLLGEQVFSQQYKTSGSKIKIKQLSPGIYFYEIKNDQGVIKTGKVVKE